jgi:hypothetical protein
MCNLPEGIEHLQIEFSLPKAFRHNTNKIIPSTLRCLGINAYYIEYLPSILDCTNITELTLYGKITKRFPDLDIGVYDKITSLTVNDEIGDFPKKLKKLSILPHPHGSDCIDCSYMKFPESLEELVLGENCWASKIFLPPSVKRVYISTKLIYHRIAWCFHLLAKVQEIEIVYY